MSIRKNIRKSWCWGADNQPSLIHSGKYNEHYKFTTPNYFIEEYLQDDNNVYLEDMNINGLGRVAETTEEDDRIIGEISLKKDLNKIFVTSNRSLEYNIYETYFNKTGMVAKNRTIINKFDCDEVDFMKFKNILFDDLVVEEKTSSIYNLDKENQFRQKFHNYHQFVGFLKADDQVLVDITLDTQKNIQVFVLYQKFNESVDKIIKFIKDQLLSDMFSKSATIDPEHTFNMISQSSNGLSLVEVETKDFGNVDNFIEDNYNDSFKDFDQLVIDALKHNNNGLILLHGLPGSGKTNYIRYLISQNAKNDSDRNIIYIPPDMASIISAPEFIGFSIENKNSIIIIEDAENILKKRDGGNSQAVANLLNISDGLLGDCLNFTIICTFNCEESEIDEALLREGRLIGKYHFDKLSVEKSNNLIKKLEIDSLKTTNVPMTLAEIYCHAKHVYKHIKDKPKAKMGFT